MLALLDHPSLTKFNDATGCRVVHSGYWELDNPVLAEINRSTFLLLLEKTTVVSYRTQQFKELHE